MVATTIISRFAMLLPSPPPVGPYPLAPAFFPLWPVIFKLGEVPPTPALQAGEYLDTREAIRQAEIFAAPAQPPFNSLFCKFGNSRFGVGPVPSRQCTVRSNGDSEILSTRRT